MSSPQLPTLLKNGVEVFVAVPPRGRICLFPPPSCAGVLPHIQNFLIVPARFHPRILGSSPSATVTVPRSTQTSLHLTPFAVKYALTAAPTCSSVGSAVAGAYSLPFSSTPTGCVISSVFATGITPPSCVAEAIEKSATCK